MFALPLLVVVVAAAAVALLWRKARDTRLYWARRGVAHEPPCPVFGSLRDVLLMRTTQAERLRQLYAAFPDEPMVGMWLLRRPALLLRDPALARAVLAADFPSFPGRGVRVDAARDPLTAHLINLEGGTWRGLRSQLSAAFSTGRLRGAVPQLAQCAKRAAVHLRAVAGTQSVDVLDIVGRYTTDVIGTCAYGLEFSSLYEPRSLFRSMGLKTTAPSGSIALRRAIRLLLPAVARTLRIKQFPEDVNKFFLDNLCLQVVKGELDRREETGEQRNDFMQLLLELRKEAREGGVRTDGDGKIQVPEEVLAAQAFVFFLAGYDSPALAATHAIYLLALHPAAQAKARAVVREAAARHPAEDKDSFTYEALQEMTYLDNVLNETMRIYPSTGVLFRECTRTYTLPGTKVTLSPGTMVYFSTFAVHRDPKYFSDPLRFDPERFAPDAPAPAPFTFLPFGAGPRFCIGQRFAYLQMKVILARLLASFDFHTCGKTPKSPLKFHPRSFTLTSDPPIRLVFQPISAAA